MEKNTKREYKSPEQFERKHGGDLACGNLLEQGVDLKRLMETPQICVVEQLVTEKVTVPCYLRGWH